ncbi:MAG: phenylalanine--tRNA ligase subunit beta [Elusimicrobia bacterium RIFOXYC2_FULL_34_12]|nr:MAG: phenylalanine--tRNA ligase subunit beta [Elusimicrobia bacterium RIFOXYC2_FULL_34_12]OGS39701.1 MAG: phenylalanine--tRNA ligase subunit beta [Elusimicrobia bacterium RIFOXYD2_FULL_34_30]
MRIPISWIRDFVDIDTDSKELSYKLTMSGIETHSVKSVSVDKNVVVAKILSIEKHPNADKLSICEVTDGQNNYKIVCGAKNIKAGDIVPLAKIGAKLPKIEIKKANLRGVESQGMLCSETELDIGEDSAGIFILPEDTKLGTILEEYLNKIELIETEVTINRGDCLSIFGISREISAIYNIKLKKIIENFDLKHKDIYPVSIENNTDCQRYCGLLINNVKVDKSPQWLIDRIESCGLRPINNVVDITNYILLEYGQPLHAFDVDKIKNKIIIRNAQQGEKISALDNKEYLLDSEMLIIADENIPIATAGVIGGEPTSVSGNTKNIFLEAAYFNPISIRRTSKKLAISTDSSHRFIRGIDIRNVPNIAMIAAEMIQNICGGKIIDGIIDIYQNPDKVKEIILNTEKVCKILNADIKAYEMMDILNRLGFDCIVADDKGFLNVTVPSHRNDINMDVDLIEEIARIYGYDKIKTNNEIKFKTNVLECKDEKVISRIKNISVALGFNEVVSYNFVSKKELETLKTKTKYWEIRNPISSEEPFLATTLLNGLIKNSARNFNRGRNDIKFFEIGKTFGDKESMFFSGCVSGNIESWWKFKSNAVDFYFLKGFIEAIFTGIGMKNWKYEKSDTEILDFNQSSNILIGNKIIGSFGLLNTDVMKGYDIKDRDLYVFELNLDELIYYSDFFKKYKEIPKYPSIQRDISIEVSKKYASEEICNTIRKAGGDILKNVVVSDIYLGTQIAENCKSLTFSIKFLSEDKTLKDEEVELSMNNIISSLKSEYESKLR